MTVLAIALDGDVLLVPLPRRGRLILGRDAGCDVVISERSISRAHAIVHCGQPPVIEDLASLNGTRVDGETVGRGERAALAGGSVLELGNVQALVAAGELALGVSRLDPACPEVKDETMRALYGVACAVGPTDLSVLLHGERGVGKSFLARVVHRKSARAERAFTHHRCERALPLDALLDDGTLFLEEVGDLPARTQDRILEAIREGRRRVRLVASTSRDLVSEGFRRELLERLSAVSLRVPPLRHRARDVPGLAQRFLDDARARLGRAVALSGEAAMELAVAPWTGNVPELRDHVLCAARACQGAVIERSHIETAARRREVNP